MKNQLIKHLDVENTIFQMKSMLDGINSRLDIVVDW